MVHWLLSTTRFKTFALIGRCLRRGVIILQRAVEINSTTRCRLGGIRLQRLAIYHMRWLRGAVVERRSLIGELSLSCARPAADG